MKPDSSDVTPPGVGTSRRSFLRAAGLLPAAAAAGFMLRGEKALADIQPIQRPGGSELKVSLNAFSFAHLLFLKVKHHRPGGTDLFDLVDFCAKHNIDGLDATGYFFPGFPNVPDDDYIYRLKRKAFEAGVGISGTGVRNNFTTKDKATRDTGVKIIKDWVIVASKLGAPVLRVFADTQMRGMSWRDVAGPGATRDQVYAWEAEDLRECAEFGQQHGVIIGVQNHGDFIATGQDLLHLLNLVNSKWCGPIIDTGYFRSKDPYQDIKMLAPYAVNWQVKQSVFGEESNVHTDLVKLVRIVRGSGYRGYLPVETLSVRGRPYDPWTLVPKFISQLRQEIAETA
jgi:sugar phosphate isomerase/epimerase